MKNTSLIPQISLKKNGVSSWNPLAYPATITYIISIVLINTLFLYIPFVSIRNIPVTPADITAGSVFVFRDFAQREIKHKVIFAMLIASFISYFLASKEIAIASFAAFLTAESIDWAIFTFTKRPLSKRLLLSALLSCPADSYVFFHFVHNLSWLDFYLMTAAKFFGVFLIWLSWKIRDRQKNGQSQIPSFQIETFTKSESLV